MDFVFIGLTILFFGISVGLVAFCNNLQEDAA